jgi:hypothetical protein
MESDLMLDFDAPNGLYRLTFEDDGRVAYAYLKKAGDVVGDVWLYNRCLAPEAPEWSDRSKIPFANPRDFIGEDSRMLRDVKAENVQVDWEYEGDSPVAYVYLFGDLYGVVGVGDKPGCARHATKDGPLAKVMEVEG